MKKAKPSYFGRDLEAMSFAANYHEWILDEFRPFLGSKVAEVGAVTGSFTELIDNEEIDELVAFEPSVNMYPALEKNTNNKIKVTAVNQFFGDAHKDYVAHFNSIAYVNVLEHIENDQLELSFTHDALKEDGYLLIFVPALSVLYSDLDRKLGHYRLFRQ